MRSNILAKKLFRAACYNTGERDPIWEIFRLRLNWLYIIISSSLDPISYVAAFTSFHQFVTNPRSGELNTTIHDIEPGLGQNENFYSWTLALFSIGSLLGAIGAGCFIKLVPYWYLNMAALLAHTFGYILILITYEPSVVMISKALSGIFVGAQFTIALAYLAESSVDYTRAMRKLGKSTRKSSDTRNHLYALHYIGNLAGFIIGPGAAIVFAQFDINQFRAIVWFNVAAGVVFIVLQLLMFHGEIGCNYKTRRQCACTSQYTAGSLWNNPIEFFIILFLMFCASVFSFRFGVYETIFNPVLSDYFGLTERSNTYFFFGLMAARIVGTVAVLLLQFKLNSRIIAIANFAILFAGVALITDWQAIPNDPCTEYSPFHHPEIVNKYQLRLNENKTMMLHHPMDRNSYSCIANLNSKRSSKLQLFLQEINIHTSVKIQHDIFITGGGVAAYLFPNDTHPVSPKGHHYDCHRVRSCDKGFLLSHYKLNSNYCLELQSEELSPTNEDIAATLTGSNYSAFLCKSPHNNFTVCFDVPFSTDAIRKYIHTAGTKSQSANAQVIQVLDKDVDELAMQECIQAHSESGWNCQWLQNSVVTKEYCEDCQPICRSSFRSLNFIQFCLGAGLLMASMPFCRITLSALTSDRVRKEMQGMISGASIAFSSVGRAFSPLCLDVAYEGIQKRTFLVMAIMAGVHVPFLVGIVVMYRKLGEKHADESVYTELTTSEDRVDDSETEVEKNGNLRKIGNHIEPE